MGATWRCEFAVGSCRVASDLEGFVLFEGKYLRSAHKALGNKTGGNLYHRAVTVEAKVTEDVASS